MDANEILENIKKIDKATDGTPAERVDVLVGLYFSAKELAEAEKYEHLREISVIDDRWNLPQQAARQAIQKIITETGQISFASDIYSGDAHIRAGASPKVVFDSALVEKIYQQPDLDAAIKKQLFLARKVTDAGDPTLVIRRKAVK